MPQMIITIIMFIQLLRVWCQTLFEVLCKHINLLNPHNNPKTVVGVIYQEDEAAERPES